MATDDADEPERPRYRVEFARPAAKQFRDLPKAVRLRIAPHIEGLATDPRPHGCVKLTGSDEYRIRVGDYRVVYAVEDRRLIVLVVRVAHRRDVYHP